MSLNLSWKNSLRNLKKRKIIEGRALENKIDPGDQIIKFLREGGRPRNFKGVLLIKIHEIKTHN